LPGEKGKKGLALPRKKEEGVRLSAKETSKKNLNEGGRIVDERSKKKGKVMKRRDTHTASLCRRWS